MKTSKIIGIGAICFVVFAITIIATNSLGGMIESQQERNYQRFVTNVDGLTKTFRQPIEQCAQEEPSLQDQCKSSVMEEFQILVSIIVQI